MTLYSEPQNDPNRAETAQRITIMKAVDAYREAVINLFGATAENAARAIVHPDDDPGGWAPGALAILYLEGQGDGALEPIDY